MQTLYTVLALVAGAIVGYFLRHATARKEQVFVATEKTQLNQRCTELTADLAGMRSELAQIRELSEKRAGFESLCSERQAIIDRLTADTQASVTRLTAERQEAIDRLTSERHAEAARLIAERDEAAAALRSRIDSERALNAQVSALTAELRKEREAMAEKIALLDQAKAALADQFQKLAADILEQKSKTFGEVSQKDIQNLLNPLREQINDFRKKVEESQSDSRLGVNTLQTLVQNLSTMNQQLSEQAHNLATALRRDTKAQGNWGETILRNILDKSGLLEGTHYSYQESFIQEDADGAQRQRRQTDVIVKLPEGRRLIIDSKVSLNAYSDSVNAENEKLGSDALKRHVASVRGHFTELSLRNYQSLLGGESPDFVVMFIPIEPAFLLALQGDEKLWSDAYEKGVLLCGPTTVLFVVRIVQDLWQKDQQVRNVKDVIRRGELLYDKFIGFVSDMEKIGKGLQSATDCYSDAMSKLSRGDGHLIGQVEKLRKLGIRSTKSLPRTMLEGIAADEPLALAAAADQQSD